MKKKYKLIHPYRHHSYHIIKGMVNEGYDIEAIYGFYDKFNINKILKIKKLKGYYDNDITHVVKTYISTNVCFILNKMNIISSEKYIKCFQKKAIKEIKRGDTVIVLQDYCQEIIDYCINEKIDYIYDHIMPCGYTQRSILINTVAELNISEHYTDNYMPCHKIEKNYKNIKNAYKILNASDSTYNICNDILSKNNEKFFKVPYGSNFKNFSDEEKALIYIREKVETFEYRKMKVLYVASISLIKGSHLLIDIIKKCNNNKFEFGVIGVANSEYDDFFLKELLNLNNVTYYGAIPHKEIVKIYMQYDVFVFTSLIEGFGMVTLEAMSIGMPCIVNKNCSSVINNNMNGIIVNDINGDSYVNALNKIRSDRRILERLSINAYRTSQYYTWNRYNEDINKIFDKE